MNAPPHPFRFGVEMMEPFEVMSWAESARELVTDLFRRQASDAKTSRAEALRQAMIALMDGPGYVAPDGKALFAYAHPMFWAPYTVIGDGDD